MGILSDPQPSNGKRKYISLVSNNSNSFCFILYIAGLLWFCALGFKDFQSKTYFSENALLPGKLKFEINSSERELIDFILGLVTSELKMDSVNFANTLLNELQHERETHKTGLPYPWLQAKMKQIGLETYVHNFTLNYPYGGGKTFQGKNVYGIVRAPRIGSTESILLSMPYRPPNSAHTSTTPTIPLLLAFAEFARRQKYWSKDLIFLVSDQEQLGMQAFLEAYFGEDDSNILDSGKLYGRAGNIIAAVNFEIQDFDLWFNNLKIEGLNGRLPNLDLHNLVVKLSHKQGIATGYRMKISDSNPNDVVENLQNLLAAMWTQSSGVRIKPSSLLHISVF